MHKYWESVAKIVEQDILKIGIENFLQIGCIHETMFTGTQSFVFDELKELEDFGWHEKIIETTFIPKQLLLKDKKFTSGNTVHNTYHLLQFVKTYENIFNNINTICEIGAGYGNLARIICDKLKFVGQYYIYDIPIFQQIQKYYLGIHLIDNIKWLSSIDYKTNVDLLIGTWSISEMPYEERNVIFDQIDAKYYLIGFSSSFEDILYNYDYFQELIFNRKDIEWKLIYNNRLSQIFDPTKVYYLFGKKI